MKTFNELFQELMAHPDCIAADIIDKEFVMNDLYEIIELSTATDLSDDKLNDLCDRWYDTHRADMKKNFDRYFEMGERYHYLNHEPVTSWLEKELNISLDSN